MSSGLHERHFEKVVGEGTETKPVVYVVADATMGHVSSKMAAISLSLSCDAMGCRAVAALPVQTFRVR